MFLPRYYRCLSCEEKFILSDGVIVQPSIGVSCPHCGSNKTTGRVLGTLIIGIKKLFKI